MASCDKSTPCWWCFLPTFESWTTHGNPTHQKSNEIIAFLPGSAACRTSCNADWRATLSPSRMGEVHFPRPWRNALWWPPCAATNTCPNVNKTKWTRNGRNSSCPSQKERPWDSSVMATLPSMRPKSPKTDLACRLGSCEKIQPNCKAKQTKCLSILCLQTNTKSLPIPTLSHVPFQARQKHNIFVRRPSLRPRFSSCQCGRGAAVDEAALAEALNQERICDALDVFETEPLPQTSPLWTAPHV